MNLRVTTYCGGALLLLLSMSGCKMIPKYEQPALPVAAVWEQGQTALASGDTPDDWRDFYQNRDLQTLIQTALENNRDLRVATLNSARMEALFGIQKLALFPRLDVTGSDSRSRTPADLGFGGSANTSSTYRVGLQMPSFELDFFGRVRSLKQQALETYLSTQEAELSYQSSLIASVASQYYTVLAYNSQLALTQRGLATAEKNLQLTQAIYDSGAGTELDLRTAEGQVHSLRATLVSLEQQIAAAKSSMTLLLGSALPFELDQELASTPGLQALPAGLPSDLLVRRPDIRAAEHQLLAANANIGAARAAFFPSISLTAFGGTASAALDGLFEDGSGTWSFVPSVRLPIFAGGQNQANLEIAKVDKQVEIANYEKAIQTAFKEVSDGLTVQASVDRQISELTARFNAAERRYELSINRFEGGLDSYQTVLLAEQERISAEQALVETKLYQLVNQTQLFAALGLQSR